MTTQGHDRCDFGGATHALCASAGEGRLRASSFGIQARAPHTANHRGYHMRYAVDESALRLREFQVTTNLCPEEAPRIEGRVPEREHFGLIYRDLDQPVTFTGGMLLGSGLRPGDPISIMPLPWNYDRVLELLFEQGRLVDAFDRSAELERMRRDDLSFWARNEDESFLEGLFSGFSIVYRPSVDDVIH